MRTRSFIGVLAALSLMVLTAPAASATVGASAPAPHTWHILVGAQGHHRAIQTMGFYPRRIWVDQGDTVVWRANSAEIHTVTFLAKASPCPSTELCAPPQGFDPGDMRQSTPQGGTVFDGSSYFNSGVMTSAHGDTGPLPPFVHVVRRYALKVGSNVAPGSYTYLCLVHGKAMVGRLIVQPAGTAYPYTQRRYDARNRHRIRADLRDGNRLWQQASRRAHRMSKKLGRPSLLVGAMDPRAMVMRFIGPHRAIRAGHRVTFLSTSMGEPHTVTFGNDETGCGKPPCNPEQPWNVRVGKGGHEHASFPGHNGGFTGSSTALNSGLLLALPPGVPGPPSRLTMRFPRHGRFHYTCALHDYMGMAGTVRVTRRHHHSRHH